MTLRRSCSIILNHIILENKKKRLKNLIKILLKILINSIIKKFK